MTTYLNIGLARDGQPDLNLADIVRALSRSGIGIFSLDCRRSDTEMTAIVTLPGSLGLTKADDIARWLDQDCIAQYDADSNTGRLVGPKAEAWGPFNLDYFLFPNHLVS